MIINDTYSKQMNDLYYNPKLTQKKDENYSYFQERSSPFEKPNNQQRKSLRKSMRQSYKYEQNKDIDKFLSVLMQDPNNFNKKPEASTVKTNFKSLDTGEEYQIFGV